MRSLTLVEVTVALALAALLAGTALAAYRGHVQAGDADGVAALDRARVCDPEGRRPRGARC